MTNWKKLPIFLKITSDVPSSSSSKKKKPKPKPTPNHPNSPSQKGIMISLLKTVIFEHHSPGAQALVPQPESRLPGGAQLWPAQPGLLPTAGRSRLHTCSSFRGLEGTQSIQRGACSCILLTDANDEVCLPLEIISSATKLALICCLWSPSLAKPGFLWIKEV